MIRKSNMPLGSLVRINPDLGPRGHFPWALGLNPRSVGVLVAFKKGRPIVLWAGHGEQRMRALCDLVRIFDKRLTENT